MSTHRQTKCDAFAALKGTGHQVAPIFAIQKQMDVGETADIGEGNLAVISGRFLGCRLLIGSTLILKGLGLELETGSLRLVFLGGNSGGRTGQAAGFIKFATSQSSFPLRSSPSERLCSRRIPPG